MPVTPAMQSSDTALAEPNGGGAQKPASGRRVAGQDPVKRAQILDAAKNCFLREGFEATSMNDITRGAGVSKGTLYVYFTDKEDLFAALCDRERTAHMDFARQRLEEGTTVAEALTNFGVVVTTRLTSDHVIKAQRMVLGIAEKMPELAARFFGPDPFSAIGILRRYLDAKVAEGVLDIADTELAGRQFLELAMAGVFKRRLFGTLPHEATAEQIQHMVESAVDMFLSYYGAGRKSDRRPLA